MKRQSGGLIVILSLSLTGCPNDDSLKIKKASEEWTALRARDWARLDDESKHRAVHLAIHSMELNPGKQYPTGEVLERITRAVTKRMDKNAHSLKRAEFNLIKTIQLTVTVIGAEHRLKERK